MNLIIDIGNTRIKVAIVENQELIKLFSVDEFSNQLLVELIDDYPNIDKAIVSSVKNNVDEIISIIKTKISFVIKLDHNTKLPLKNKYETPKTLGKDRIAAAVGANFLFPNTDVLIIDAGTAITYDFVNHNNEYQGGFITPGLNMRLKALYHFTDKLPLLTMKVPQEYRGINTEFSIKGGIHYGLEGEVERIINNFSQLERKLKIILTGGDTKYFEKLLKNYNFVALEIIVIGLNTILESNYIEYKL